MSTGRLARTQPAASRQDLDRERARLVRRWPAAVRDVLLIASRVGHVNRDALALGLPVVALDPPVAIADALWRALLASEPVKAEQSSMMFDSVDAPQAAPGPPQRRRGAVRSRSGRAGGARCAHSGSF